MNYYDNVKDSVKNEKEKTGKSSESGNKSSFSTLKEEAEKNTDQEGNDTPIEVLEEDGLKRETRDRKSNTGTNTDKTEKRRETASADTDSIERKLDKIIEQNSRMIEILESFGN